MKQSYLSIVFLVFILAACSSGGGAGSDALTPVSVSMKIPAAAKVSSAAKPVSEGVLSVHVRAEKSGGAGLLDSKTENVEVGQTLEIKLLVAPGQGIVFTVEAFSQSNGSGAILYRGIKVFDVIAGTNPTILIEMQTVGGDLQISPQNPTVAKGSTLQFLVSGIDPSQVDWQVTDELGGLEELGTIDSTGLYEPPSRIPVDSAQTPLGTPLQLQVEAEDQNNPANHDQVSLKIMSGKELVFEPNQQITPSGTGDPSLMTRSSGQRNIVYFEGNAYVVWEKNKTIYFSETQLGSSGLEWTIPTTLFPSEGGQEGAAIAVGPDGSLYVVFVDCSNCSDSNIILLVRKAAPQAQVQPQFVQLPLGDANKNTGFFSRSPSVAISPPTPSGSKVFVAWSASPGETGNDILFQRVDPADAGMRIDPNPRAIAESQMDEGQPTVGVAMDGAVFVAWIEARVSIARSSANKDEAAVLLARGSSDGGETFGSLSVVSEGLLSSSTPTIAAGKSRRVYLAWEGIASTASQNPIVYFNTGTLEASGAIVFEGLEPAGSFSSEMNWQMTPSLAWDGSSGVYLALHEVFSGFDSGGLFLGKRLDGDDSFSSFEKIDDDVENEHGKQYPSITVDSAGRGFAVWTDRRGGITPPSNYVWFAKGE